MTKPRLIVALDVDTLEKARILTDKLSPVVDIFKVGSQLFTACGPAAVKFVIARGKKVFLDLKYHDIPHTVARAVEAAIGLGSLAEKEGSATSSGIFMYTLHVQGGVEMLKSAVSCGTKWAQKLGVPRPLALGITVLTSEANRDNIRPLVLERAHWAREAGCDGVVASVEETKFLRSEFGNDFIIVTPGIRPAGDETGDQKRVATPLEAVRQGSNFLVVGRPIVEAKDPFTAANKIIEEMNKS